MLISFTFDPMLVLRGWRTWANIGSHLIIPDSSFWQRNIYWIFYLKVSFRGWLSPPISTLTMFPNCVNKVVLLLIY